MVSEKQKLGNWGEKKVAAICSCPACKRKNTTRLLPTNFKCADLICDFCGYLSQVKTARVTDTLKIPKKLLGGAWTPQAERMKAGVFFSLYVVLTTDMSKDFSIYFLPADLQTHEMFEARKPLTKDARRAGWQGFVLHCGLVRDRFVRLQ